MLLLTISTLAAYGIQFVDEDYCRLLLPCRGEEVPHALRTDADEHLVKFRTRREAALSTRPVAQNGGAQTILTQKRRGKVHRLPPLLPWPAWSYRSQGVPSEGRP